MHDRSEGVMGKGKLCLIYHAMRQAVCSNEVIHKFVELVGIGIFYGDKDMLWRCIWGGVASPSLASHRM
jgi:hypothetical protein